MEGAVASDAAGSGGGTLAPKNPFASIKFADVCELFEAIREVNHHGIEGNRKKRQLLTNFFQEFTPHAVDGPRVGAFDLYRLILPGIDKERSAYNLKEAALARCLGLALGLKRGESPDFLRLEGWRKQGIGVFPHTVFEVMRNHRPVTGVRRADVGDVNAALDALATTKISKDKVPILRSLLDALDATQTKWLVAVILKDLKLGYGEVPILRHYHPDAVDLYNVCCDLRRVCETLHTRSERFKRQDVQPGSLVKAMNASRVHGCEAAWNLMKHKRFVVENKFDGERIQVHRVGPNDFRYFTRNNHDFGPRGYDVLNRLLRRRLRANRCVLDGELVVWNRREGNYAPFGYLKSLVKAINEGRDGDERCRPDERAAEGDGGDAQSSRQKRPPGTEAGTADADDDDGFEDLDDELDAMDDEGANAGAGGAAADDGGVFGDVGGVATNPMAHDRPLLLRELELVYVAFDVLYDEDHSVIDRPLRERHEVLASMFKPLVGATEPGSGSGPGPRASPSSTAAETARRETAGVESDGDDLPLDPTDGSVLLGPVGRGVVRGRVVLNVPATGADDPPNPNCVVGGCLGDIEDQLWLRIERQEEGLVCKDLDSKWVPGERDKRWIKLKPDYLPTEDLDVVVMGGFYGTGRLRGGKIAEYLVGVVERPPAPGSDPKRVLSFTKVGTGMSAEVMGQLRRKLDPHMRVAGKGHKPPAMYLVTGEAAERPDVWIDHPENSVVFTVKGDIRLVRTKTFRTPYSLRFPRVTAVRWENPWTECMTEDELERKVEEDGGVAVKPARRAAAAVAGASPSRPAAKRARAAPPKDTRLPAHLAPSDTRHVARSDDALAGLDVCVIVGGGGGGGRAAEAAGALKQELVALVATRGGRHSETRHAGVTHVVAPASARHHVQFIAAVRAGGVDVLTPEWLRECVAEGRVVEPRPRHRLHLSRATVDAAEGRVDSLGDAHDVDVNREDLHALAFGERANAALAAKPPASEDVDALAKAAAETEAAAEAKDYDDDEEAAAEAEDYDDDEEGARTRIRRDVFAGCAFAIVSEGARVAPGRRAFEGASGGSGAAAAAVAATRASTVPVAVGAGSDDARVSSWGECARAKVGVELSIRLRGGEVCGEDCSRATHVVLASPGARGDRVLSDWGGEGPERWGAPRGAKMVTMGWVRARAAEGRGGVP